MKTLIAYGTRYGVTAKSAQVIAETLRAADGREVVVSDARRLDRDALAAYDSFVIGSSIAAGRWKPPAKRLLGRVAALGKPVAVFVSAGGVMSGKKPGDDPKAPPQGSLEERESQAIGLYIDTAATGAGLAPVAKAAFGGRMAFFGKVIFDNWDRGRVEAWARLLASALR